MSYLQNITTFKYLTKTIGLLSIMLFCTSCSYTKKGVTELNPLETPPIEELKTMQKSSIK